MPSRERAFVANEPLIVLVAFALLCLLAGWGFGSVMKWPIGFDLLLAVAAFVLALSGFAAYARWNRSK